MLYLGPNGATLHKKIKTGFFQWSGHCGALVTILPRGKTFFNKDAKTQIFLFIFLHFICEKKIQKFASVNISKKETDTRFRSVFCLLCGIHTIDLNAMGSRWSTVYYQQGREPFQPLLFM